MIRDSNKMKYKPFFFFLFCLDEADTKNKKMNDINTEKLKGNIYESLPLLENYVAAHQRFL
jgi:hypothetical protein